MKKLLIGVGVVVVVGVAVWVWQTRMGSTADWQTYRSEVHGVQIKYPQGYQHEEVPARQEGLIVTFAPAEGDGSNGFFTIASGTVDIGALGRELQDPKYASAKVKTADLTIQGRSAKRITGVTPNDEDSVLYMFNDGDRHISLTVSGKDSRAIAAGMIATLWFTK